MKHHGKAYEVPRGKHPMMIDAPETPYVRAHKDTGSIPARLTLIPKEHYSFRVLNPFLKAFKQASVLDPEQAFPVRPPKMVNRLLSLVTRKP